LSGRSSSPTRKQGKGKWNREMMEEDTRVLVKLTIEASMER